MRQCANVKPSRSFRSKIVEEFEERYQIAAWWNAFAKVVAWQLSEGVTKYPSREDWNEIVRFNGMQVFDWYITVLIGV